MKDRRHNPTGVAIGVLAIALCIPMSGHPHAQAARAPAPGSTPSRFFLPDSNASKIVSVARADHQQPQIVIMTEAVAIKETGPKAAVTRFGEVYAFSPTSIFVHEGQPTTIAFWNLQPDDEHDFAIVTSQGRPLMDIKLAPLSLSTYVFTFHERGIFDFRCLLHQPEMSGQILVMPHE